MGALATWYLFMTLGLPAFGVLLLIAALFSCLAVKRGRAVGQAVNMKHPKRLAQFGTALIVLPTVYFAVIVFLSSGR